jgi:hypothetical protein
MNTLDKMSPEPSPRHDRSRTETELTPAAWAFLKSLPAETRIVETVGRYPHVVNRCAEHAEEPELLERVLFDLTTDRRGNRHGFPIVVLMELTLLHEHVARKRLGRNKVYELSTLPDGSYEGGWRVVERTAELGTTLVSAGDVRFDGPAPLLELLASAGDGTAAPRLEVYVDGRRIFA